jgi:hypothetical protein
MSEKNESSPVKLHPTQNMYRRVLHSLKLSLCLLNAEVEVISLTNLKNIEPEQLRNVYMIFNLTGEVNVGKLDQQT